MKDFLKKLDILFENLFVKKAPPISVKAKEWMVKAAPWLALIFGIIALPGIFAVLGFGTITAPFWAFKGVRYFGFIASTIASIIQVALELMAVSALFKKLAKGWQLLYYSTLLGVISAVLYTSVFGLLTAVVSLYLLYQIKSFYK